jgi:hypothetical protein
MTTSHDAALRQTIATLLLREAGTDEGALPEATLRVYDRLAQRLSPLIGDAGVTALAARSLHLAQREFPWLAEIRNHDHGREPFAQLGPCLARQDPLVARDAAAALLATFNELLRTLVGERLTARLVGGAWLDGPPETRTQE